MWVHNMKRLITIMLFMFICCFPAYGEISSWMNLQAKYPGNYYSGNPIITHDVTYTNYSPAGWIVDPSDSTKFIFYEGQFQGNVDVGSRVAYYTGLRMNPYSMTYGGVAISQGTSGQVDSQAARFGSVILSGGTVYYYYVCINNGGTYAICLATSSDGKTFTKQGAILSPDGVNEAGFTDPSVFIDGSTKYLYVTKRNVSTLIPSAIVIASSSSFTTGWTKTGTTAVSLGTGSDPDAKYIEGANIIKVGNDYVLKYTACSTGDVWSVNLAYASSANSAFTKYGQIMTHSASGFDSGGLAVSLLVNSIGNLWVDYYQGTTQAQPASIWDIGITSIFAGVATNYSTGNKVTNLDTGNKVTNFQ